MKIDSSAESREMDESIRSAQLAAFLQCYGPRLEQMLANRLPLSDRPGLEMFNQAVSYALFPGGKRMRPLFTLLAARTMGGDPDQALPVACAIEYFHSSSLIFDDLPAMDNARQRRGKAPVHRVFGEDEAVLAGLALFNQGYALVGEIDAWEKGRRLLQEIVACIGPHGMIGGQFADLRLKGKENSHFRPMQYLKTTSLMRLMVTAGAITAGAGDDQIQIMAAFGERLGVAYQMLDDIIDLGQEPSAPDPSLDARGLWQEADRKVQEARQGLLAAGLENEPSLLIELADSIFAKLKKQAAHHLTATK